jgi:3-methyladenine DNA glycosylase AlkD
MKKYLDEVTKELKSLGSIKRGEKACKYLGTSYTCLGLSLPEMRKLLKRGFSFSGHQEGEVDKIWNHVFLHGHYFEVLSLPLIYFQSKKKDLTLNDWSMLKKWIVRIDNWEHSDRYSDIIAEIHERYPKKIYTTLQKWNTDKHPWYRRQSIVGLFLYSNARKKQPPYTKVIRLIDSLIFDKDTYVQKGVGWTLRELFNVYPKRTYQFLLENAADIHPAAWQAATEKLTPANKNRLKQRRKRK